MTEYQIRPLTPDSFSDVLFLAELVHGENYIDQQGIEEIHVRSLCNGTNCSFVAYDDDKLVGFRLTYAPQRWDIDHWCTPDDWNIDSAKMAYFKSSAVLPECRGSGLGGRLLDHSIAELKKMGAAAGLAHIWMQSPNNSAFRYFSKSGGQLVKIHPKKWNEKDIEGGYQCPICGNDCHCDAAEMMIRF